MEYYVLLNGAKEGPYSLDELKMKNIDPCTKVWRQGFPEWRPARWIPELTELFCNQPPVSPTPPVTPNPQSMPKTWLAESILVTCFCCLPFGIVGIVNSTKIESAYLGGDYSRAQYYSSQAKKWTTWGFYCGIAVIVLYILSLIIGIAASR